MSSYMLLSHRKLQENCPVIVQLKLCINKCYFIKIPQNVKKNVFFWPFLGIFCQFWAQSLSLNILGCLYTLSLVRKSNRNRCPRHKYCINKFQLIKIPKNVKIWPFWPLLGILRVQNDCTWYQTRMPKGSRQKKRPKLGHYPNLWTPTPLPKVGTPYVIFLLLFWTLLIMKWILTKKKLRKKIPL